MTYGTEHPYQQYDPNFKPDEVMMRLHQLQSRIASTISSVTRVEGDIQEKQSQIYQDMETIQLSVLAIDNKFSGDVTRLESTITQTAGQIESRVTALDTRIGSAESAITQQAGEISLRVRETDLTGNKVASLINQTATTITIAAHKLDLAGYATFYSLTQPGATSIHGGNIMANTISANSFYGNVFTVGNGVTSTKLTMTTTDSGSHTFHSTQAAGFRISSDGSLSLAANPSYGIYTRNAPFVVESGFRVDSGTSQFNTNVTVNATLNASALQINSAPVATQSWTASLMSGYATQSWVSSNFVSSGHSHSDLYGSSSIGFYISGYQAASITSSRFTMQGVVKCTSVDTSSDVNLKTEIADYTESAIQKILDTPIVSYRYKDEPEDARRTVGIIAQIAPDEVYASGDDGKAVSLYPMISLAWKAIQELNEKVVALGG